VCAICMAEFVGVVLALAAATSAAATAIFVRLGTAEGSVNEALTIILLTNLAVLLPVAAIVEFPRYTVTTTSLLAFGAAGLVATLLGRIAYFTSIERIGVSRTEPIKSSMPLYSTLIAVLLLGEVLTSLHLIGIVLIVVGVAIISWEINNDETEIVEDITPFETTFPFLAAFLFGVEPIFVKFGLATGTSVFVGTVIKTVVGLVGFVAYLRWRRSLPGRSLLRQDGAKWMVLAGIGNTVATLAYYGAISVTPVVIVVPLFQVTPLIAVVLSFLALQHLERVTLRLLLASGVVVAGVVLVTAFG